MGNMYETASRRFATTIRVILLHSYGMSFEMWTFFLPNYNRYAIFEKTIRV